MSNHRFQKKKFEHSKKNQKERFLKKKNVLFGFFWFFLECSNFFFLKSMIGHMIILTAST